MYQDSNLMASVELTWDNTSRTAASVWSIIFVLYLACLLACLTHLCLHLSAKSCVSWMSSYSSWALAWLASHRSLREEWYPNSSSVWVLAGWQPSLPQSGSTLPDVEEELMWGLTGILDQKDGVPPLNSSIVSLGDRGTSPAFLSSPHMVAAHQSCWKEVVGKT